MKLDQWLSSAQEYILWLVTPMPVPWSAVGSQTRLTSEGTGVLGSIIALYVFYAVPVHRQWILANPPDHVFVTLLVLFLLAIVSPVIAFAGATGSSVAVLTSQWVLRLVAIQWIFLVLFALLLQFLNASNTGFWAWHLTAYSATAALTIVIAISSMRACSHRKRDIVIAAMIFLAVAAFIGGFNILGLKSIWWNTNPE
jgi:hypothetical protein